MEHITIYIGDHKSQTMNFTIGPHNSTAPVKTDPVTRKDTCVPHSLVARHYDVMLVHAPSDAADMRTVQRVLEELITLPCGRHVTVLCTSLDDSANLSSLVQALARCTHLFVYTCGALSRLGEHKCEELIVQCMRDTQRRLVVPVLPHAQQRPPAGLAALKPLVLQRLFGGRAVGSTSVKELDCAGVTDLHEFKAMVRLLERGAHARVAREEDQQRALSEWVCGQQHGEQLRQALLGGNKH